ncbi:MAG: hypothetical protein IKM30_03470 [Oscillospiraceae bacterium]|nr:hypothetical protein [Oscillospiraceae bacterium]
MQTIETAILAACSIALGLSLAEGIIPMERFGKQIRWLFSLMLMIGMLTPLRTWDAAAFRENLQTNNPQSSMEDLQHAADTLLCDSIEQQLIATLNQKLSEHKAPCTVQALDVHIQEDGSIVIYEAAISGNILTGSVYLHEWLGADLNITAWEEE